MTNFWQRAITGVIFVIVVVGAILLHAYAFVLLFLAVITVGMYELNKMLDASPVKIQKATAIFLGLSIYGISSANLIWGVKPDFYLLTIPIVAGIFIYELFRQYERPFWNVGGTLLVPVYCVLPFVFLQKLAFISGEYNANIILSFLFMVWMSDTGAYLVGITMGKRRLFPRISPKKSWEGFIGGIVFTLILAYVLKIFLVDYPVWLMMGMGLIISVTGTLGDLTESMLKRSMEVKDSGTILPGHGGVLDRFDAYTFAAPLVYVLFYFFA
jgi:phosphatidate cytidylyltransferase